MDGRMGSGRGVAQGLVVGMLGAISGCAAPSMPRPATPELAPPLASPADDSTAVLVEDSAQGPPPAELSPDTFVYLAGTSRFPTNLYDIGPRVVRTLTDEVELTGDDLDDGEHRVVSDEWLAEHDVARPDTVWMFGSAGPCQATLGEGYVGYYAEGPETYELGFLVEPCTKNASPIAMLGPQPPQALRWVPAEVVATHEAARADWLSWEHPVRNVALERGIGERTVFDLPPAPVLYAQLSAVPGSALHQLITVDYWPDEHECGDLDVVQLDTGLWDGKAPTMRWIEPGEQFDLTMVQTQLIGAVLDGTVPVAIVHDVAYDLGLATRTATGTYDWALIETGWYHDEVLVGAGFHVADVCGPWRGAGRRASNTTDRPTVARGATRQGRNTSRVASLGQSVVSASHTTRPKLLNAVVAPSPTSSRRRAGAWWSPTRPSDSSTPGLSVAIGRTPSRCTVLQRSSCTPVSTVACTATRWPNCVPTAVSSPSSCRATDSPNGARAVGPSEPYDRPSRTQR